MSAVIAHFADQLAELQRYKAKYGEIVDDDNDDEDVDEDEDSEDEKGSETEQE